MKIAVIGAGSVGLALGKSFAKSGGHDVVYGVRSPAPESDIPVSVQRNVADAIADADLVLLSVPFKAALEVARSIPNWRGKILVDCTNPINADFSGLEIGHTTSAAEEIQRVAIGAKVVKCFNQTGAENMAHPKFMAGKPVLFAAGDDTAAVGSVATLAEEIGFECVRLPNIELARQLEQLAWLWIYSAFKTPLGRDFAFGLMRRN